jgi:putative addiction module component (TIGR02574 family)
MPISKDEVFEAAVNLSPTDRAQLVEVVLSSFSFRHTKGINEAWARESEDRIDAFEKGEIESIPIATVFDQINSDV